MVASSSALSHQMPNKNSREQEIQAIVQEEDRCLANQFYDILKTDEFLTRKVVSFQDNKERKAFRWYKYKEGFSASLAEYLLSKTNLQHDSILLDPFAGSGEVRPFFRQES